MKIVMKIRLKIIRSNLSYLISTIVMNSEYILILDTDYDVRFGNLPAKKKSKNNYLCGNFMNTLNHGKEITCAHKGPEFRMICRFSY